MTTPLAVKEHILLVTQQIVAEYFPAAFIMPGACLYWSAALVKALRENGFPKAVLQAGSLQWPFKNPDQDDGVSITHFAYEWQPDSEKTKSRVSYGMLPEMHCWVGIVETQELVDLTTRQLPEQMYRCLKQDWIGDKPPDYLWTDMNELPDRVVYKPDFQAIVAALKCLFLFHKASKTWLP